jgi:hypothetical protein
MRWYILRALLHKEALRHVANRGGIVLAFLLLGMALLLSFSKWTNQTSIMPAEVQACLLVTEFEDDQNRPFQAWVNHLKNHVPDEWKDKVRFRKPPYGVSIDEQGRVRVEGAAGSLYLKPLLPDQPGGPQRYRVQFTYPGEDANIIAPFEAWFWKETRNYFDGGKPMIEERRERLAGSADIRSLLATALIFFGLFLPCLYLMPTMNCEERERGVMLAQALSPASPLEIIAAKFLFYPLAGVSLATVIAGVYSPSALLYPQLWLTLFAMAVSWLGIGMTIGSLAKNQRLASLGAMCYLILLCLYMLIVQQTNLVLLMYVLIEYHSPVVLQQTLSGAVDWYAWVHVVSLIFLAVVWAHVAVNLFRRYGWQ